MADLCIITFFSMSLWSQLASCTYWRAPTINLGILPRSFMSIMRVSMTYCPLHKTELLVDTIFLWCKWPEEMASLHDVEIEVVLLLLPPSLPYISHSIWTLSQWHNMSFHCSAWGQSLYTSLPQALYLGQLLVTKESGSTLAPYTLVEAMLLTHF